MVGLFAIQLPQIEDIEKINNLDTKKPLRRVAKENQKPVASTI